MSCTLIVSGVPCKYQDWGVSFDLMALARPAYNVTYTIKSIAEADAALSDARRALAGRDMYISTRIKGRKPNGYDKWEAANKKRFYVQAGPSDEQQVRDMAAALEAQS